MLFDANDVLFCPSCSCSLVNSFERDYGPSLSPVAAFQSHSGASTPSFTEALSGPVDGIPQTNVALVPFSANPFPLVCLYPLSPAEPVVVNILSTGQLLCSAYPFLSSSATALKNTPPEDFSAGQVGPECRVSLSDNTIYSRADHNKTESHFVQYLCTMLSGAPLGEYSDLIEATFL